MTPVIAGASGGKEDSGQQHRVPRGHVATSFVQMISNSLRCVSYEGHKAVVADLEPATGQMFTRLLSCDR